MSFSWKKILIWIVIAAAALLLVYVLLRFFSNNSSNSQNGTPTFGNASQNSSSGQNSGSQNPSGNQPLNVGTSASSTASAQKVFLISDGPVVAATLLEEGSPSVTNARFITADDGHVLDLPLDVPGSVPRIVSQTTIPGIERALWTDKGGGVLMQYLEGSTIKTVHLAFQAVLSSTSTPTAPQVIIQFLPDNIEDLSVSPDGSHVTYLLRASVGLVGYTSLSDGTRAQKLFSLPLSEVAVSWSSQGTILAYSKASAGVPGILFSINTKNGAVSPLLYGQGILAAADQAFSHLLYQINDGGSALSYIDTLKTGAVTPLSGFSLNPEQCSSSGQEPATNNQLYCAAPVSAPGGNFLDLWHQGAASTPDNIISLNLANGTTTLLAEPGGSGGENSNVMGIAVSPLGRYLSFVNKNNGRLWGVRLSQ